jgi:hypothetical protein
MELPREVRLVANDRIEAGTIEQHVRFFSPLERLPLAYRSVEGNEHLAIEYEYRCTEYRPPRRTEHEYDEIRCEARAHAL